MLPQEEFTSEQIEDVLGQLSELGVNVVEAEEADEQQGENAPQEAAEEEEASEAARWPRSPPRAPSRSGPRPRKEPTDRTDDPVRMYLREMGSVELLSREGEIAIAKRIEAGARR